MFPKVDSVPFGGGSHCPECPFFFWLVGGEMHADGLDCPLAWPSTINAILQNLRSKKFSNNPKVPIKKDLKSDGYVTRPIIMHCDLKICFTN